MKLPSAKQGYSAYVAWGRFARLEDRYHLLAREVNVVDMRIRDRLVVSVTDKGRRQMQGREWTT